MSLEAGLWVLISVSYDCSVLECQWPREASQRAAVRRLTRLHKVDMLCLPETKVHKDVESIIYDIWGSNSCGWE